MQLTALILLVATAATDAEIKVRSLEAGRGTEIASKGDVVTVHYKVTLDEGALIEDTRQKHPYAFKMGAKEAFGGLEKAVAGMKVAGKSKAAGSKTAMFGDREQPKVPKDAQVLLEVEVFRIDKKGVKQKLEMQELQAGSGKAAEYGDKLQIKYIARYLDGKEFDNSNLRGGLFDIDLGRTRIIQGLEDGLLGMKVGGKRYLTIPYELAWIDKVIQAEDKDKPPVIYKYCVPIFEVELRSLEAG